MGSWLKKGSWLVFFLIFSLPFVLFSTFIQRSLVTGVGLMRSRKYPPISSLAILVNLFSGTISTRHCWNNRLAGEVAGLVRISNVNFFSIYHITFITSI